MEKNRLKSGPQIDSPEERHEYLVLADLLQRVIRVQDVGRKVAIQLQQARQSNR